MFGLRLLRSTIITDTVNLSPLAKKATPKDERILNALEKKLGSVKARENELDDITAAKCRIDGFSVEQLMRKDLKVRI